MPDNVYDAIVVGSGIAGGWAAKELTEKGLKVLLLGLRVKTEKVSELHSVNKVSFVAPWVRVRVC